MKNTHISISILQQGNVANPNSHSIFHSRLSKPLSISHSVKKLSKQWRLLTLSGLILSSLVFSTSYAALSASTANTIEGSEPYFVYNTNKLTSINELVGFVYPDASAAGGKVQVKYNGATQTVIVPTGIKFNEIELLVPADDTSYSLNTIAGLVVDDDDGDASGGVGTATGNMQATFKDEHGTVINNLNQPLLACKAYTLTIKTTGNVKATTPYGAPNTKSYTDSTATYNLALPNFCYIQPYDMTVYSNQTITDSAFPYVDANNPGGYNPAVWDYDATTTTHKGFNVLKLQAVGKDFPTTGFENAILNLKGVGNDQSVFRCQSTSTAIKLSGTASTALGQNCQITYKAGKPAAPITITMEYKDILGTWQQVDNATYTIPVPTLWAEAGNPALVTGVVPAYTNSIIHFNSVDDFTGRYHAAESCGLLGQPTGPANHAAASAYFFKRSEMTNAPQANAGYYIYNIGTASWDPVGGATAISGSFSHDADTTFMGEWGRVGYYVSSPWSTFYRNWASEAKSLNSQYTVDADGYLNSGAPSGINNGAAVCKR